MDSAEAVARSKRGYS